MVNTWDIYLYQLDPAEGSEQKGLRPVLIISNDAINHSLPISTVLPFSSVKTEDKIYPSEVLLPADCTGLSKNSVVMIHQIRTISHSRLVKKIGDLNNESFQNEIKQAIRDYFEL